jgi:lipopolysaccharide transport system ATP-binding protein
MPNSVVTVEKLSKRYLVGHRSAQFDRHLSFREMMTREVKSFARNAANLARGREVVQGDLIEEFWALKNVNFEISQGEAVGIIGRNGAGKSTLLKILSRITEPTEGRVKLRGRVASLLEVGTGFHQELTGRENIFLNGAILGMKQWEIRRKFDEIVAFAEVERFLDTPVKRYSSGMYVRLAFSVAAHLEPEILIVDEVLAVGDVEFQKKCLGKMDDVSRRDGRTVLFVSHSISAIKSLCPSIIWLDQGSVRQEGAASSVINDYLVHGVSNKDKLIPLKDLPRKYTTEDRLRLDALEWLSEIPLRHGEPLKARIYFTVKSAITGVAVGIGFSSLDGKRLLTYDTDFQSQFRPTLANAGSYSVDVEITSLPMGPDLYHLDIGCRSGDDHLVDFIPAAANLEVIAGPNTPNTINHKDSAVRLGSNWSWNLETGNETEEICLYGKPVVSSV